MRFDFVKTSEIQGGFEHLKPPPLGTPLVGPEYRLVGSLYKYQDAQNFDFVCALIGV